MYGEASRSPHRLAAMNAVGVLKVVLIRAAVTLAGAVKGLTLSQRKAAKALLESSHVTYLLKLTQRFGCNGDGDEIAPTERCEQ